MKKKGMRFNGPDYVPVLDDARMPPQPSCRWCGSDFKPDANMNCCKCGGPPQKADDHPSRLVEPSLDFVRK